MAQCSSLFVFLWYLILTNFPPINGDTDFATVHVVVIDGKHLEAKLDGKGSLIIKPDKEIKVRIFGRDLGSDPQLAFTKKESEMHSPCEHLLPGHYPSVDDDDATNHTVAFDIKLQESGSYYYLCLKTEYDETWRHQGTTQFVRIKSQNELPFPLWLQALFIVFLLFLSGLFSGLNLGLMSLDKTDLKILEQCGSTKEKKYAKVIRPIRARGNFLLCTLLIGNVLVNSCLAILLERLTQGIYAIIGSTAGIVIFGEIIPQALCSRHGLAVGAKTIWMTRFFMVITFAISWPISKLLDLVLGEEIGQVYSRERIQGLIQVTKDFSQLKTDEMDIISGAMQLTRKTVADVMTRIEDVYMIEYESVLDFYTMSDIMKRGYTRIPVFESDKGHIVAILNTKDLAFVDPTDEIPLKTICKFYNRRVEFVFEDEKLDEILKLFKQGRTHLAIVQHINNEGEGDPFYETVGLVTLEDVIEEIIQSEIVDETDVITDNRKKMPRFLEKQDFSQFNQPDDQKHLSPQLKLAAYQFLSTIVEPFKPEQISDAVLEKLFNQDIVKEYHYTNADSFNLYTEGVGCDYFILLLVGRVEVTVSKEKMVFEGGPFTYYGVQALIGAKVIETRHDGSEIINFKREPYIPDYTVHALSDLQYIQIGCGRYFTARRATLLEKGQMTDNTPDSTNKTPISDGGGGLSMSRKSLGSCGAGFPRLNSDLAEKLKKHSLDHISLGSYPLMADDRNTPVRTPGKSAFYTGDRLRSAYDDNLKKELSTVVSGDDLCKASADGRGHGSIPCEDDVLLVKDDGLEKSSGV